MGAKFRMRVGRFNETSGTVMVWLYFEKSQTTKQVLKEMKYTVQYGLEKFLLYKATRNQATIEIEDSTPAADETKKSSAKPRPKTYSDIDLNDHEYVRSMLDASDGESPQQTKRRGTFSEGMMKTAIAKALAVHANEGTSQEGLMSVTNNVYDVVSKTMDAIANDMGGDLNEAWSMDDLDKVVAKTNELTTQTEGEMDTREPSSNPLLGPAATGQNQSGSAYKPLDLAAQPQEDSATEHQEPPDEEMAEVDATLTKP